MHITHVRNRPGRKRRYAIGARKIERELGWPLADTVDGGIRKAAQRHRDHPLDWVQRVQSSTWRDGVARHCGQR